MPETHAGSPLTDLHATLGARFTSLAGRPAVAGYGPLAAEVRALREGAALVDRSWMDRLALGGEDRLRFLSGLVTCAVKELAPGEGTYGFFTSAQGRILADAVILALEKSLWLELPPGTGDTVAAHLAKYAVMDRVEVAPLEEWTPLAVAGARCEEVLAPLARLPAEPWSHREAEVLGIGVRLVRRPLAGLPAFTLWAPAGAARELAEGLLALEGLTAAGLEAVEALRVAAGIPAFGCDFGPDHFPQESGLEAAAVSYTKGCYLGQEVVARIHYRGGVNRLPRRLLFAGEAPPEPGIRLLLEGTEVGRLGSAALAPGTGRPVGIAVVHRRGAEPGTRLEAEGYGEAEVAALPEDINPA